jgi:hypothetical protein
MNLTGTDIVKLLETNDHAICRALVVLYERQTADEKTSEHTKHDNGRGFRPCHARMGTSMAKFYLQRGFLTSKQIAYWRKPDKRGGMRIAIYWRQLLDAAHKKAAAKAAQVENAEREMQRMEAQGDRLQTILEENAKLAARIQMEKDQMMGAGA